MSENIRGKPRRRRQGGAASPSAEGGRLGGQHLRGHTPDPSGWGGAGIDGDKADDPALEVSPEKPVFSRLENAGLRAYGCVNPNRPESYIPRLRAPMKIVLQAVLPGLPALKKR